MEQYALKDLEIAAGVCFVDRVKYPDDLQMTYSDFSELLTNSKQNDEVNRDGDYYRVNFERRLNFLIQNGYALTNENIIDITLAPQTISEE